ncbi:hypothetical protein IE81DRAFT_319669 [Ceraceosorus guamensis]|uniref:Uncharacterized protein n=1 Tax=Ceraceosorus guamensis TaxID=1522189 RepID=A0A316W7C7_9BASI|nr:hypothetical protein IE81DRAFT_319669 [Ceraceosorus guamensis]PWN45830.1 hypothetical protein IE81DRAFT_319669 [Ceraceosorus guamensis]
MHAKNESDFDPVKTRMPLIPGQLRPPKEAELDGPVRFTMQRHVRMKTNALLGSYTHTTEEETHIPARWMGTRGNEDIPGFHWSQPKRIDAPKYFWKSEALIGGYLLPQVIPAMSSNHLSYSYALRLRVPIAGTGNGWDRTVCGWGAVGLRNSDIDALGSHASQAVLGERAAAKLPGFELPHEGGSGPPFDGPPGFPMVNDLPLPDEASGLPAYHRVPQAGEQTAIAPARRSNATSNVATGSMPVATPAAVPTASDGYNKQPW